MLELAPVSSLELPVLYLKCLCCPTLPADPPPPIEPEAAAPSALRDKTILVEAMDDTTMAGGLFNESNADKEYVMIIAVVRHATATNTKYTTWSRNMMVNRRFDPY